MHNYEDIMRMFAEMQAIELVYDRKTRSYDETDDKYTSQEVHLLEYICDHPKITVTKLAEVFYKSKSAISHTMKRLEQSGLIDVHKNSEDMRFFDIYVTTKGHDINKAHKAVDKMYCDKMDDYIGHFSKTEMATIMQFLNDYHRYRRDTSL
ncbi:MarR family transcriptional regulator [Pseudovibrio sp. Tun.PSC04-5.I4]|uniref:MarR family winged helix-turn-helix transcriptional regulator n=1 Tax=Pseudovibrio sp. Tun.PSC04-5.I4 TaxID=1798213 RepID=UPI000883E8F6|nr:MarR family transcriptional regulator [Pseudovibrio sp. Tun.PSC04-5.I4]SDR35018.1 DNA-binding transcriptional regulator, MarR family [Pseudovibrio sp. Tun.PSC04-5.I4]